MLRIIDARTGEPLDAAPVRRGLTRVEAHATRYDTGTLRVLLVADLLVRALELGGTPVRALLTGEGDRTRVRAGAAALGVRPFEEGRDTGLREAQTLHVVGEGDATPDGVRITVAPVEPTDLVPASGADPGAPEHGRGTDPAVLRMALLSRPRSAPVRLDDPALEEARATLVRWRRAVAEWARQPSRPVPEDVRGQLRTAWEDDLDVPGVLGVLRRVEEAGPELPDGARFETYAYADRLLGLELTRDLGAWA
ncbi:cysteinyl-tRNA synthetase [Streptomyces griseus]|uniref:cysteinyl-tRNA synthetase n=1 Tax=Streptomyces griseus TaxID=1911 RepID=UPI00056C49E4|nr:cysteinyl-tRNA synthetase [Streptomyces griseus]